MEISELQEMWKSYDNKLEENIRLNKEVLRKMISSKSERRFNLIKLNIIAGFIVGIVLFFVLPMPNLKFRNTFDFYAGLILFSGLFILIFFLRIKQYILVDNIDFTKPISVLRKKVLALEKHQQKILNFGFVVLPLVAAGIFLLFEIPVFRQGNILPVYIIIAVWIVSFTLKYYSNRKFFEKIDQEIREIEELEKD